MQNSSMNKFEDSASLRIVTYLFQHQSTIKTIILMTAQICGRFYHNQPDASTLVELWLNIAKFNSG